MRAEIPGYYFNEEMNRYFKIMPTGPHSLAAINQARQVVEREKVVSREIKKQKKNTMKVPQYVRWRQTMNRSYSPQKMIAIGHASLFRQTTPITSITLPHKGASLSSSQTCLDVTSSDTGEIVCSFSNSGMSRYGYQVTPFFHVWGTETHQRALNISSLQFANTLLGPDRGKRTLVGTFFGGSGTPRQSPELWRFSIDALPMIDEEAAEKLILTKPRPKPKSKSIRGPGPLNHGRVCQVFSDQQSRPVSMSKVCNFGDESLWSSAVDDTNDTVVVGGDRFLYCLTSEFVSLQHIDTRSSVFTVRPSNNNPKTSWYGCRNGTIGLFDARCNRSNQPANMFQQSSSVTQLSPLENLSSQHTVLAAGTGGLINIWDIRSPFPIKRKGKNICNKPVRSFTGHQNEHTHSLPVDTDLQYNVLLASGDDSRLRLWSLLDSSSNEPIWTSERYENGPVSAAKFVVDPPKLQDIWKSKSLIDTPYSKQCYPGILTCVPTENEATAMEWLSWSR
ncbi:hypothetical protein J3Q64DRAFT_1124681 [Phycomyces blakesleeanus]